MNKQSESVEWRRVVGFAWHYEISDNGQVRSIKTGRILKTQCSATGYATITLRRDGKNYARYVHRLVAQAFFGIRTSDKVVNHKDGNRQNNHVDNLEWCTRSQNAQHAIQTGLNQNFGSGNSQSKLTEEDVRNIRITAFCGLSKAGGVKGLAKRYGVSQGVISGIINNKTWKHVETYS
jgi:hypothetical protein